MLTNLTQGHLSLLETCPRKFQHLYLEGLTILPSTELQASQVWGSRFHLLMQQRELGLPLLADLADDEGLQTCAQTLMVAAPNLFKSAPTAFRQSEHRRLLSFNGYTLTVIYDLLILTPEQGLIVDWKTYLRPPQGPSLERDWQTRLYLYVLTETTGLRPEQVAMHYWFVRCQDPQTKALAPQQVQIHYSLNKHEQTRQDLLRLTQRLSDYQVDGTFPQVGLEAGMCDRCPFTTPCDRTFQNNSGFALNDLPTISEIEEVPL